ncbi:MAG: thioredoxin-disulfide reductase [Candidatus Melainabacteria bacterium]|nr:MAG: thioredoxin-disulfide reductase [Candidatus Melainabacteria bacterium]
MAIRKKLTILGSGSAGLTAAIYAARANLEPLVVQGLQAGGQLTITTDVENFPGFPEGIQGPELMEQLHKQAERFGTQFIYDNAESVDLSRRPFVVRTSAEEILTDTLLICTGASAKLLGLESESKLMGHGVSACATCDGFFFKDKVVFVVGGGDTALEEAMFLTRFATSVTVVHRRDQFRASAIMVERAKKNEKVKFILDTVVEDIENVEKGEVTGIKLRNLKTKEVTLHAADGVFVAIGHKPNTELFRDQIELTENGYIVTNGVKTSVHGVFAAGDVQDELYRQAITAAGTGCAAALEAQWLLESEEGGQSEAGKSEATVKQVAMRQSG